MNTPLFLIPIVVGLITQFSKRYLNKVWLSDLTVRGVRVPRYGGMPSAHTAFALSIATLTLYVDGISSMSFAFAVVIVIFIIDDALRMRVFLGRQAQTLHILTHRIPKKDQKKLPHLETRLGHTLPEVIVGAIVGIVLTFLLLLLFA